MSKKKVKPYRKQTKEEFVAGELLKLFKSVGGKKITFKQVKKKLSHRFSKDELYNALKLLEADGKIENKGSRFKRSSGLKEEVQREKQEIHIVEGIVDMTGQGNAYVISPGSKQDIYIDNKNLGTAFDSDKVRVQIFPKKGRKKTEGKIIEILHRANENFVGIIQLSQRFAFMIPDSASMPIDFFIPLQYLNEAKDGDKVVVKMIDWVAGDKNPTGAVVKVLGKAGTNEVEMGSILVENGFHLEFPKKVLDEAEAIPVEIPGEEINNRKDFRSVTTFTIDPEDAQDFDDALSIRKLENGNWEVGVHIADVSYYSRPGTLLDKEAYERATSVYLVDRCVPMFPEKLSNVVCSLRPQEEKLCFAAVFEMNEKAEVLQEWFGRTVIFSDKRFVYEEAQQILDAGKGIFYEELNTLNKIAYKLREKRFKNGSVNFDTTEIRFKLDEEKRPIGIVVKERKDTHLLVEDFMLLANKKVAEFAGKKKHNNKTIPFVYRIHDLPDTDKLEAFAETAMAFGYKMNISTPKHTARSLNKLLEEIKGKPEQNMLESLGIRTMAKAIYSTENIGHYGLAFPYYTHFTSPIRRYPDIMVHRILAEILSDGKFQPDMSLAEKCNHSSEMERKAADAERTSVKFKQVEFMQSRIGEEFEGIVTGVTGWGIFVEIIETKCEGLVRMDSIKDDFYVFDEKQHAIRGREYGEVIRLGDKVRVKVYKTNIEKRQMDLLLVTD